MSNKNKEIAVGGRPLIFGEVLFDAFPDGSEVLGGAPFNVAWHLEGFGLRPLLVSRVGADIRGRRVTAAMRDRGMDVSGVQRDDERPTGSVRVTLPGGQPAFDILPAQAYDSIDAAVALEAAQAGGPIGFIYHGTLALREAASLASLRGLRGRLKVPRCVDLNLRAPWWDEALAEGVMQGATWVKLNEDELRTVTGGAGGGATLRSMAEALRTRCDIGMLVVTLGERGAFMLGPEGFVEGRAPAIARVVDTVGAGDAFSAVAIAGLVHGWSPGTTLGRALEFAARVCGERGAIPADRDRYAVYREQWGLQSSVEP